MTDYLLINVPFIFLGTLCPNSVYNENVRRISSQLNWSIIFPFIKRAYRPSLQPRRRADSGSCRIFRPDKRRRPGDNAWSVDPLALILNLYYTSAVGRVRVEISTVDFLRCGCGSVPAAGASAKKLLFAGHKPSQPALGEQLASSRRRRRWQKM